MQIATITSSGKSVTHAEGVFAVDGETVAIGSLMDYDRLGMLTWASDETREWARQLAHPTVSEVAAAPPTPSAKTGGWLRKSFNSPVKIGAAVVGLLVVVLLLPALFWAARDLMHPVTVRATGQLPDITALFGQTERDAQRMLGDVNEFNTSTDTGTDGHPTTTHSFEMLDVPSAWPPEMNSVVLTVDEVTGEVYLVTVYLSLPLGTYTDVTELLKGLGYNGKLSGEVSHNELTGGLEATCWLSDSVSPLSVLVGEMASVRGQTNKSLSLTVDLCRGYTGETGRPLSAADLAFSPSAAAPAVAPETTASSQPEQPAAPSTPTNEQNADGTSSAALSQKAIDYAKGLGGKSHKGETLYLIIGAVVSPESFAQLKLDNAAPGFGDMQSYFIVQKSDNFGGLESGSFVVIEAYRTRADAEDNLDFAKRGFEDDNNTPYIKKVTVETDDPIPVNYVDVDPK